MRRGREVFAENCARCHSSIPESVGGPFKNRDFYAVDEAHPRKCAPTCWATTSRRRRPKSARSAAARCTRITWPATSITEYGSETLRGAARGRRHSRTQGQFKDGGRGYYRNISLLNVWATAPFMHNNAIGPELCGKPTNKDNDFFRSRYVDATASCSTDAARVLAYDPSVDGRFKLYSASMHELLNPKERGIKTTLTDSDIIVDLGIRTLGRQDRRRR